MRPYFGILEDDAAQYSVNLLFSDLRLFGSMEAFKPGKPNSVFWLSTTIRAAEACQAILSFKHLTYADLYIMPDTTGAGYTHQRAGAFRPAKDISHGDSRFHFQLSFAPNISYKILIRSQHTKQYQPVFDFKLEDQYRFYTTRQRSELIDFWFQGAGLLLLLHVLISWFITWYRPYLWLAIFITGLMLYNLALSRYMIDWFFFSDPSRGWRLTIHFLHIGIAGLYLLILDFWKIKQKSQLLYRFGKAILYCILTLSLISFLINYYTANFKLMSQINGLFLLLQVAYLVSVLQLWKRFDKQERFLAYGVIVYLSVALAVTIGLFVVGESVFNLFSILSGCTLVTVSLLFFAGINGKLWQNEKDKNLYLTQLNLLQQQQNQVLEANVTKRTHELNRRNKHIELLMNELNHRVKNNLQLLYSLNILQLSGSNDGYAANVLKDNVARIKAMMLVNDSLNPGNNIDKKTISPVSFITDIVEHSQRMFAREHPVEIELEIDRSLVLDATTGLCLGLILTELLTNSYKHAFASEPLPKIVINIQRIENRWDMLYFDNGSGIADQTNDRFGLSLIGDLTRQLKGDYKIRQDNGTSYFFSFPYAV